MYTANRYYDPATEQFISVDPLVSQTGQPFSYANDNPVNASDPSGLAPQAPQLSPEEQQALDQQKKGEPVTDPAALKSALQKIKTAEKYAGQRNVQKRQSNFAGTPTPDSQGIFGLPEPPLLQSFGNGLISAGKALRQYGWPGEIAGCGLIVFGGIALAF